jgi:hypothetical protein
MPYITTSRNVKQNTRRLARSFCLIFSNFVYENRGKKNFDSIAKRAIKLGFNSIIFIYESHGNPSLIEKVELNDKDEWEITEKICFNPIKIEKPKKDYTKHNIEFQGEVDFFKELVEYEESNRKKNIIVKYENKKLYIICEEKEVIVLKLI